MFLLHHFGGRAVHHRRAQFQYVAAMGTLQRHTRILFDQQDGEPFVVQLFDQIEELDDEDRRQPKRWLVEHHERRFGHKRTADRQHLLLPAGQHRGRHVPPFAEIREALVDLVDLTVIGIAARIGAHLEVLMDGQADKNLPALRHQNETLVYPPGRAPAVDRFPGEANFSGRGPDRTLDCFQQRALAGAVGPEHGDNLALADGEAHRLDRMVAPVADVKSFDLKQHRTLLPPPRHQDRPRALRCPGGPPRAYPRRSCARN